MAEAHHGTFTADKTANLVARLRHNVIRAGLRRINLAYSRISLQDVAAKLGAALRSRGMPGSFCLGTPRLGVAMAASGPT